MDGRLAGGLVVAAAERLAVDGDDLPGGDLVQRGDPAQQALLELGGLDRREDGVEPVVGGDAAAEVEELGQPGALLAAVFGDRDEVIGPGDDGAEGDGDDVDERVDDLASAGVGEGGEVIADACGLRTWRGHS